MPGKPKKQHEESKTELEKRPDGTIEERVPPQPPIKYTGHGGVGEQHGKYEPLTRTRDLVGDTMRGTHGSDPGKYEE